MLDVHGKYCLLNDDRVTMKISFRYLIRGFLLAFTVSCIPLSAQDQTVAGNLTVNEKIEIISGDLVLGRANFDHGNSWSTGDGFRIQYNDTTAQTSIYTPGVSSVTQIVGHEIVDFVWGVTYSAGTPNAFVASLMSLSNERLLLSPSLEGLGTQNVLTNQTLAAGGSSILTKTLGDGLYLSRAGGTITGNVTITGSASIGTLSTNFTGQGTDNRLTNQVANHANSILTKGIADGLYMSSGYDAGIPLKFGQDALVGNNHSIALGHFARANTNAISIGSYTNYSEGASGNLSLGIGYLAFSSGERSISLGHVSVAEADDSIAMSHGAITRGKRAIAIGRGAEANRIGQVVIGSYNSIEGFSTPENPADHIFMVGNGNGIPGDPQERSNAFAIRRNGDTEIKGNLSGVGTDNRLPNQIANNADSILTVETADSHYIPKVHNGLSFVYGENASIEFRGIALGYNAGANANAISIGHHAGKMATLASGEGSISIGYAARGVAVESISLGTAAWGGGDESIAIGKETAGYSHQSVAIGKGSQAYRKGQVVLGNYNASEIIYHVPDPADNIFVIGNGTADNARSNAFAIKRNGNVEVKGTSLTVNGNEVLTATSASSLYVTQSSASTTYLTSTAAATQYVTKTESADFLTADDLVAIQADIDTKIGEDELEAALENIDLSGNYLSKDPQVGLAYGTDSEAAAGTSALGTDAVANQAGAHAMGSHIVANRPGQIVVGSYNDYGSTEAGSNTEAPEDPVFVVATGKAGASGQPDERQNALEVQRNGSVHVKTVLRVEPAGNLLMGDYAEGPRPVPVEE